MSHSSNILNRTNPFSTLTTGWNRHTVVFPRYIIAYKGKTKSFYQCRQLVGIVGWKLLSFSWGDPLKDGGSAHLWKRNDGRQSGQRQWWSRERSPHVHRILIWQSLLAGWISTAGCVEMESSSRNKRSDQSHIRQVLVAPLTSWCWAEWLRVGDLYGRDWGWLGRSPLQWTVCLSVSTNLEK